MGMESMNKTAALEALSPYLNHPRRTVIQAEVFTSGIILLLLLQLILGSFRRQSTNLLVQGGTWMTYTVSLPAIAYTLGLMQSSPVKNVMYPIWAISLLMAAGYTNAARVYELDDNRQWKRGVFNIVQYSVYVTFICYLLLPYSMSFKPSFAQFHNPAIIKSPSIVIALLTMITMFMVIVCREIACVLVELGYNKARKFAKFLEKLPAAAVASDSEGIDPASSINLKGYKYPVHIGGYGAQVTIDQIWHCDGRLLSSGTDHSEGLKDTCLAFSMYQLLKQRYYGMTIPKECLAGTHHFLLSGLLKTEAGCKRAFRIVEMELGFCHDHFLTKHAIIFEGEAGFFFLFLVRILLLSLLASFVVQRKLDVRTPSAIIEVQNKRADDIITLLVLATILLVEILQAAFYLASDWCKVSVTCRYAKSTSWYIHNSFTEKLISYISRFTIFGYWKNSIGQHSMVLGATNSELSGRDLQTVRQAVVESLVSCDGVPTNGEGSLGRNGVLEELCWSLIGQSQAEIMLIWNVATYYCDPPISGDGQLMGVNKQVSVSLSRYCAYLMKSAPELLPENFGDTKSAMADVQGVFNEVLKFPNSGITQAMDEFEDKEDGRSIFMRGVKLGKQLKANATCWKIIADFWSEKILYIAPTHNVKGHMKLLAKGGEFLTHIWVLLTHSGIIEINRRQPSQEDV
ncbi:hypothetical protein CFC21_090716 [Triticum aestivum]|uniref:DUF4220 domain-containing protein n=2 Tax=Triticum aestivum TaxID=4565 RepID=A0A9R1LEV3_WHEAT|nr:hypothetical protein CFC21_090716 [Triticum aestivum]